MNYSSPLSDALARNARYYGFLVLFLVLLSAQGSFVNDMYTPALPSMCRFFGCSVSLGQMGLTMGMIGLAVGQFLLGPVSDRYGRKPVMIVATAVFVVAAVVSVFSTSIHIFNLCRLFQGLGASAGYFLAKTIPADVYSGRKLASLMALVGAINGIAPASSPVIGGFLADRWGWKSIFIALAAFSAVIIVLSFWMKESVLRQQRVHGSFMSAFGGYGALLRNRPFMIHTCLKGFALGLLFCYISSSPFIMQNHYGLSQTSYGLVIGFNAIFMAAGSMLSLKFRPYKRAAFIGAIVAAVAMAVQAVGLYTSCGLWFYNTCNIVSVFALGMIFATTNTLAMNEGRGHTGEAAAVIGVTGYIVGGTVSPLAGIGDVLHSTAVVNMVLVASLLVFVVLSRRIPADLGD